MIISKVFNYGTYESMKGYWLELYLNGDLHDQQHYNNKKELDCKLKELKNDNYKDYFYFKLGNLTIEQDVAFATITDANTGRYITQNYIHRENIYNRYIHDNRLYVLTCRLNDFKECFDINIIPEFCFGRDDKLLCKFIINNNSSGFYNMNEILSLLDGLYISQNLIIKERMV